MRFKVIEGELLEFEKELNEFVSRPTIKVMGIVYCMSGLPGSDSAGWLPTTYHSALIQYEVTE
ncbi:MAG: hypothetical protein GX072_00465 [Lysinibacillus sp.]|nr:hypothetical protein [Lysinibacillus sp.]